MLGAPIDILPDFQGPSDMSLKGGRGKGHPRYGRFVYALARHYRPDCVVEAGTFARRGSRTCRPRSSLFSLAGWPSSFFTPRSSLLALHSWRTGGHTRPQRKRTYHVPASETTGTSCCRGTRENSCRGWRRTCGAGLISIWSTATTASRAPARTSGMDCRWSGRAGRSEFLVEEVGDFAEFVCLAELDEEVLAEEHLGVEIQPEYLAVYLAFP